MNSSPKLDKGLEEPEEIDDDDQVQHPDVMHGKVYLEGVTPTWYVDEALNLLKVICTLYRLYQMGMETGPL